MASPDVGQRFEWNLRGASSKRHIAKRFTKSDYLYSTWTPVLRIITDTTGIRIADYNTGSGMNVEEDEYLLMGTYEVTAVDDTKTPIVTEVRQVSKTTSRWSKKSVLEVTWTEPGEVGNRTHITMEENGTVPLAVIAGLRVRWTRFPASTATSKGSPGRSSRPTSPATGSSTRSSSRSTTARPRDLRGQPSP